MSFATLKYQDVLAALPFFTQQQKIEIAAEALRILSLQAGNSEIVIDSRADDDEFDSDAALKEIQDAFAAKRAAGHEFIDVDEARYQALMEKHG